MAVIIGGCGVAGVGRGVRCPGKTLASGPAADSGIDATRLAAAEAQKLRKTNLVVLYMCLGARPLYRPSVLPPFEIVKDHVHLSKPELLASRLDLAIMSILRFSPRHDIATAGTIAAFPRPVPYL